MSVTLRSETIEATVAVGSVSFQNVNSSACFDPLYTAMRRGPEGTYLKLYLLKQCKVFWAKCQLNQIVYHRYGLKYMGFSVQQISAADFDTIKSDVKTDQYGSYYAIVQSDKQSLSDGQITAKIDLQYSCPNGLSATNSVQINIISSLAMPSSGVAQASLEQDYVKLQMAPSAQFAAAYLGGPVDVSIRVIGGKSELIDVIFFSFAAADFTGQYFYCTSAKSTLSGRDCGAILKETQPQFALVKLFFSFFYGEGFATQMVQSLQTSCWTGAALSFRKQTCVALKLDAATNCAFVQEFKSTVRLDYKSQAGIQDTIGNSVVYYSLKADQTICFPKFDQSKIGYPRIMFSVSALKGGAYSEIIIPFTVEVKSALGGNIKTCFGGIVAAVVFSAVVVLAAGKIDGKMAERPRKKKILMADFEL